MRPWNPNTKSTGRPGELIPGSSDRLSRSVRTVSQSPEPPRQVSTWCKQWTDLQIVVFEHYAPNHRAILAGLKDICCMISRLFPYFTLHSRASIHGNCLDPRPPHGPSALLLLNHKDCWNLKPLRSKHFRALTITLTVSFKVVNFYHLNHVLK